MKKIKGGLGLSCCEMGSWWYFEGNGGFICDGLVGRICSLLKEIRKIGCINDCRCW